MCFPHSEISTHRKCGHLIKSWFLNEYYWLVVYKRKEQRQKSEFLWTTVRKNLFCATFICDFYLLLIVVGVKMGALTSRQHAGVEEADVVSNHAYKYPPRSG